MQNASEAITNLMASLESYYDAARNAMLVKKAVKKYGKTQSIVALIGQEGLAAAQTFSMEGFWQKTKDFLFKIWSKIKEWWGKFWGMFFSIEDRLRTFKSSLASKTLIKDCEFDAPKTEQVKARSDIAEKAIEDLKKRSEQKNITTTDLEALHKYLGDEHGMQTSHNVTFQDYHHKYTQRSEIEKAADELIKVFEKHRNSKTNISRYTDNFLRNIKDLKVGDIKNTAYPSYTGKIDELNRVHIGTKSGDDASAETNDLVVKMIKTCAKVNNELVSATLKAATIIGIKLMANTRVRNSR